MTTIGMQKTLASYNPDFDTFKFYEALKAARKAKYTRSGYKKKVSFAPSMLAWGPGGCARYWQHAFRGEEFNEPYTQSGAVAMESGTDRHNRIEALYASIDDPDISVEIEKEIKHADPPIRGFIDAILTVLDERCIVDIKTINAAGYNYVSNSMDTKGSHLIQVLIYMKILGIRNGMIHYENKDNGDDMMVPFRASDKHLEYADYIFDWMRKVYASYDNEDFARGFAKTSYECKNCPVRKACWSGEDGTLVIENLRVPK